MVRFLTAVALATLFVGLAPSLGNAAQEKVFSDTTTGAPKIKAIDVIAFGPEGALLIGDGRGAQVVAIDTKDTKAKPWKAGSLEGIDKKIADRLGTTAKNIELIHLAVNRASGTAYVALRKQDESKSLIVTIDGDGKINELALDKVAYVAVPLPTAPRAAVQKITDLSWAKGRVLVGAATSEEFACKVYSIPTPLSSKGQATGFSTETYHVSHRRWETKAPMTSLMPLEHKGKQYLVGAFACTPVVRYPLDDIKAGAKVKGESVLELGNGNRPLNMFAYQKGGKSYILMNNLRMARFHKSKPIGTSPYWTTRIDFEVFGEQEKINQKAPNRLDRTGKPALESVKVIPAYSGVVHLDRLDDKQALVIKKDEKTGWTMTALELP